MIRLLKLSEEKGYKSIRHLLDIENGGLTDSEIDRWFTYHAIFGYARDRADINTAKIMAMSGSGKPIDYIHDYLEAAQEAIEQSEDDSGDQLSKKLAAWGNIGKK